MKEPHQPLEVLLGRFAARCDAVEARVIGREATLATVQRDGAPTTDPDAWETLAAETIEDRGVTLQTGATGLPDLVLSLPIEAPVGVAAALCAGFERDVLTHTTTVLWTASSFAHTMSLCLDDPSGFGRMIAGAVTDPLTQCGNALAMWECLEREINRASRQRTPLACTFVDLECDDDELVAAAGTALSGCVRGYDTVTRFGGDEFVVIMPNSTEKQARALVDRMAREVVAATTPLADDPVTASFGTAQLRFDEPAATLLQRARGAETAVLH